MTKKANEVKFTCKPHQLYNTLEACVRNNERLADMFENMGNAQDAQSLRSKALYQEHLLETLFEVIK